MALLYFKYLTNKNNSVVASSVTPFTLGPNEAQIQKNFFIPKTQNFFLYRVSGSNIVPNSETTIASFTNALSSGSTINAGLFVTKTLFNQYTGHTTPDQGVTYTLFTGYTGTTKVEIDSKLDITGFTSYTATTHTVVPVGVSGSIQFKTGTSLSGTTQLTYDGTSLNATGATINAGSITLVNPLGLAYGGTNTDLSNPGSNKLIGWDTIDNGIKYITIGTDLAYSAHTLSINPGTFVYQNVFNTYTGTTFNVLNGKLAATIFNAYTGITAPSVYVPRVLFNSYTGNTGYVTTTTFNNLTGTTLPATYQSKSTIAVYTGTTAPNQFAAKSNFNTFSGATQTALGTKLPLIVFNSYTGTTAPATFANKTAVNAYTASTQTVINGKLNSSLFNTYTGTTAPALFQSKTSIVTLTGTTLPATYQTKASIAVYTGATQTTINGKLNSTIFNGYSGITDGRLSAVESLYITGATNLGVSSTNLYTSVSAKKIQLKSLVAGTNIILVPTATGITISSIGGGGGGTGTTYAANGLTRSINTITLGGTLTGSTVFTDNRVTKLGLQYAADYTTGYTTLSIPHVGYVTGLTSSVFTLNTVEINISSIPRNCGWFLITGLTVTTGKPVYIQQASGPYTNKGTLDDEAEMDCVTVTGKVLNSTTIKCFWNSPSVVKGNFKFNYKVSN